MPGNPGSSLRCNECRRRRKKCDLQRPHCLRCRRSGIICSGPRLHQPFVHRQSDEFPRQTQRQALVTSIREEWLQNGNTRAMYSAFQEGNRFFQEAVARNQWRCVVASSITLPSAPLSLLCAAVLNEFRLGKQVGIFSADRTKPRSTMEPRIYSSVAVALRTLSKLVLAPCPTSLRVAIFGVLILYLGRLKGDDALLQKARQLYTQSLGVARVAIDSLMDSSNRYDHGSKRWFHTVCLSIVLQFFEFIDRLGFGLGGFVHGQGALVMMASMGPAAFSSADAKPLLMGFRSLATYSSIFERRSNILGEQEWMRAASEESEWSPRQQLLDIASSIPQLLSRTDSAMSSSKSDEAGRVQACTSASRIVEDLLETHQRFEQWLSKFESLYEGPLYWNTSEPIVSDPNLGDSSCQPDQKPAEAQLDFLSSPVAGLLVTYWSFQLKLWMTAIDIRRAFLDAGSRPDEVNAEVQHYSQKGREIVVLMMEAVPYLSSCLEGNLVLQAPLKLVEEFSKHYQYFSYQQSSAQGS